MSWGYCSPPCSIFLSFSLLSPIFSTDLSPLPPVVVAGSVCFVGYEKLSGFPRKAGNWSAVDSWGCYVSPLCSRLDRRERIHARCNAANAFLARESVATRCRELLRE